MYDSLYNTGDTYFLYGVIGLFAGMVIDLLVYYISYLSTPSFLYTGPLILIITIIISLSRSEFFSYINGFPSTVFESKALGNDQEFMRENLSKLNKKELSDNNYVPPEELKEVSIGKIKASKNVTFDKTLQSSESPENDPYPSIDQKKNTLKKSQYDPGNN